MPVHLGSATGTRNPGMLGHFLFSSVDGDVLTAVPQDLRHPDQLLEKFVDPADVGRVEKSSGTVEGLLNAREVTVPEDRDQSQLSHHRNQVLNDARAAPGAS